MHEFAAEFVQQGGRRVIVAALEFAPRIEESDAVLAGRADVNGFRDVNHLDTK